MKKTPIFAWLAGWLVFSSHRNTAFIPVKTPEQPISNPSGLRCMWQAMVPCFYPQTSACCSQAGNLGQHLLLLAPPIHPSATGKLHKEPGLAKDSPVWSGSHREACSPRLSSSTLAGPQASLGQWLPPQAHLLPWGIGRLLRQLPAEVAHPASQKGVAGGRETS